jgi:adenosylcobinamide-GDP ribazoletransferase
VVAGLQEQTSFFTGLKLDMAPPRWQLADVLPVLPFIGAGVGLAAGLVFAIVRGIAGPGWLAAVLAVGAAVLITRALHEDGLADTADGLGPHGLEPAQRLEIMRDSRNGTFGVLAIALSVLIKVACLAQFSGATGLVVLIGAHALSRAVLAYPLLAFSPVHADGLGAQTGKPTDNDVWLTIGLGAALAFLLLLAKGFFVALLAPLASSRRRGRHAVGRQAHRRLPRHAGRVSKPPRSPFWWWRRCSSPAVFRPNGLASS